MGGSNAPSQVQANYPSFAPPPPSLTAYNPSLREKLAWIVANQAAKFGAGRYTQQDIARKTGNILDFLPGVGEALGADDVASSVQAGNWRNALINAGALAMGVVPGAGDAASKEAKRLARGLFEMDYFGTPVRVLQNPTPQQAAGFINRTKYKAARRIHDPQSGETYLWDAGDPALHQLVAERLGISPSDNLIMDIVGPD